MEGYQIQNALIKSNKMFTFNAENPTRIKDNESNQCIDETVHAVWKSLTWFVELISCLVHGIVLMFMLYLNFCLVMLDSTWIVTFASLFKRIVFTFVWMHRSTNNLKKELDGKPQKCKNSRCLRHSLSQNDIKMVLKKRLPSTKRHFSS